MGRPQRAAAWAQKAPDRPVRRLAHSTVSRRYRFTGSTNGTYVNGARVSDRQLAPEDVIEVGRTFLVFGSSSEPADRPGTDLDSTMLESEPAFATLDPEISAEVSTLRRLAATDITISLCGETGTGKEMLSAAIHRLSQRPGALVPVNKDPHIAVRLKRSACNIRQKRKWLSPVVAGIYRLYHNKKTAGNLSRRL